MELKHRNRQIRTIFDLYRKFKGKNSKSKIKIFLNHFVTKPFTCSKMRKSAFRFNIHRKHAYSNQYLKIASVQFEQVISVELFFSNYMF